VTETDIPAAIELLAAINAAADRAALAAIGWRHGMDEDRTVYVSTKFAGGYIMLELEPMSEEELIRQLESNRFLPTPQEFDMMRAHAAEILGTSGD
jgi:hypothetical protein